LKSQTIQNEYNQEMKGLISFFILFLAVMLLFTACHKESTGKQKEIVCIHSWSDFGEEGEPFRKTMDEKLAENGVNAKVTHFYLNAEISVFDQFRIEIWPSIRDSIYNLKPDLIFVNDDPALTYLLTDEFDNTLFNKTPIVFAGIDYLMTDSLAKHPNYTGFEDDIDIAKNMDFILSMKKDPTIIFELGETHHDIHLRSTLAKQAENITSPVVIYSSTTQRIDTLNRRKADGTLIPYDLEKSETDSHRSKSTKEHISTSQLVRNAKTLQLLQVKYDVTSHALIDRANTPQFTCIRELFNNPARHELLGGYFTSMETQVNDQVLRAKEIFDGTDPRYLPVDKHRNQYFIDYEAFLKIKNHNYNGLDIDELEKRFTGKSNICVVNAPFGVTQPSLWYIAISCLVVFFVLGSFVAFVFIRQWIKQRKAFLIKQIENESDMRKHILEDSKSDVWASREGFIYFPISFAQKYCIPQKCSVLDFAKLIHPSTMTEWMKIAAYRTNNVTGKQKIRICVSFDKKRTWHWFDLICDIRPESISEWSIDGLFIDVDDAVNLDKELQTAEMSLKEMEEKYTRLQNLNSELYPPLATIIKHSNAIKEGYESLSQPELAKHHNALMDGVKNLTKIIDSLSGNALAILFLIFTLAFSSCQKKEPINVLVLHQYDTDLESYEDFNNSIRETLLERGYNADIRNFYMNLEDQAELECFEKEKEIADSLNKDKWKADIILAEGDRLLRNFAQEKNNSLLKWKYDVPFVWGGIIFPDWNYFNTHQTVSIFTDRIDVATNALMAHDLLKSNIIEIELDSVYLEDSLIQEAINIQCDREPFVNNSDLHIGDPTHLDSTADYADSLIIYVLSAERPEQNVSIGYAPEGEQKVVENGEDFTRNILKSAIRYTSIVVKKDIWSECIAKKCVRPNITARKEWYKTENYLGGYFTDYATVAEDITNLALDQFEKKANLNLSRAHEPQKHINYVELQKLGLDIGDLSDDYIIENAPLYKSHPILFYLLVSVIIIAFVALLYGIYYWIRFMLSLPFRKLEAQLKNEYKMNQIAILANESIPIKSKDDLLKIAHGIDPAQEDIRNSIIEALQAKGHHNYVQRIHARLEGSTSMEWWQLRCAINNTGNSSSISGSLSNINAEIQNKEEVKEIQKQADEAKKTELFFNTMAFELRTPLNAIVGCSDILSAQFMEMGEQEKKDLAHSMAVNNILLEKIVNDLVQYGQIATHRKSYTEEIIDVDQICRSLYDEKQAFIRAKGLQFDFVKGRNVCVKGDPVALREILYQLLNNAYKFTQKGSIAIGWQYYLNEDMVEIFVEDSGTGISDEDKEALFTQYWKGNAYIYGTGIGLHIAKTYAEAMDSTIELETEVGVGSRFSLHLPIVQFNDSSSQI